MSTITFDQIALTAAASILAALLIIVGLGWAGRLSHRRRTALIRARNDPAMILFDGETLVDANAAAQSLLRRFAAGGTNRTQLVGILCRQFPDLPAQVARIDAHGGDAHLVAQDNSGNAIDLCAWNGMLRLTLSEAAAQLDLPHIHPLTLAAIEDELDTLRSLGEHAPTLIWRQDDDGAVTWANRAYLALAERVAPQDGADATWPLARIFDDAALVPMPPDAAAETQRVAVSISGHASPQWFEVTRMRRGSATMHFAIDVNGLVEAEHAQKNFVQTLTKTFAHLSIGLAIFDRKRRLILFNPALLDLTGLPVSFLSSRPQVHTVLDRLRNTNMLPEPKNYSSWRDEVAALEAAAQNGTYCETWDLAGGQTYRVTGRPHPDGAIAFLFEDISHEVSLTRHFRAEIETTQAVLDAMHEAVAVFSSTGHLTMSNIAYDDFLNAGAAGAGAMAETTFAAEMQRWQDLCAPSMIWADLGTIMTRPDDQADWDGTARLADGRALACRCVHLAGGARLMGFRPENRRDDAVPFIAGPFMTDPPDDADIMRGGAAAMRAVQAL